MIFLHVDSVVDHAAIVLPASKSLSNRALITGALGLFIDRLCGLSEAEDTKMLKAALIDLKNEQVFTGAGGTTFRFFLALKSILGNKGLVFGTPSFNRRPVHTLVEALRALGADIEYTVIEGFPPLFVKSFAQKKTPASIQIDASISSQFISALMLVGPYLNGGLELELIGKPVSTPYVQMTADLMAHFGITCQLHEQFIRVPEGVYTPKDYVVEADWSAVAFWVEWLALRKKGIIKISGLQTNSWQGDSRIFHLAPFFGVYTAWDNEELVLSASPVKRLPMVFDLSGEPDLAPSLIVCSAALDLQDTYVGLQTLRVKESNRIEALQNELAKVGVIIKADQDSLQIVKGIDTKLARDMKIVFDTYDDHRIAMSLAPLVLFWDIAIQDPEVVAKSYPEYWSTLSTLGVKITSNTP